MGVIWTAGMDDRWYQNIFVGGTEKDRHYGTTSYNGATVTMEEYVEKACEYLKTDYLEGYRKAIQPVAIHRNVYLQRAKAFEREADANLVTDWNAEVSMEEVNGTLTLKITMPDDFSDSANEIITTGLLGTPRITEAGFENTDGSPLAVDHDLLGQERHGCPIAGPIQSLKSGKNVIELGIFGRITPWINEKY
jgi:hypothetical protein